MPMTQYAAQLRNRARFVSDASDRARRYTMGVGLLFTAQSQLPRAAFMMLGS